MKYLLTLNMGSASDKRVHQIILDHDAPTLEKLESYLENNNFVSGRLFYHNFHGEAGFKNRGDIIVNTGIIGKVQVFFENGNPE